MCKNVFVKLFSFSVSYYLEFLGYAYCCLAPRSLDVDIVLKLLPIVNRRGKATSDLGFRYVYISVYHDMLLRVILHLVRHVEVIHIRVAGDIDKEDTQHSRIATRLLASEGLEARHYRCTTTLCADSIEVDCQGVG